MKSGQGVSEKKTFKDYTIHVYSPRVWADNPSTDRSLHKKFGTEVSEEMLFKGVDRRTNRLMDDGQQVSIIVHLEPLARVS